MEDKGEDSVRTSMDAMRAICDREISTNKQKMDSFTASFRLSMESSKIKAQQTVQNQVKLTKMKADLRQAEGELVKVLAVKTRKLVKQLAIRDLLSVTKARLKELKRDVEVQRARRDEYSEIISQQSLATSAEKTKQEINHKGQIQEAISWYNRVLGLHVDGGHGNQGVRFTFSRINMKIPNGEYYFTIHHADDSYTLLHCNPPLNITEELIQELNRTNGFFKFVRIMREKFEQAAVLGLSSQLAALHQDFCSITVSVPSFSASTDQSDSPTKTNKYQIQRGEGYRQQVNEVFQRSESIKKNQHQIQHGEGNRQSKKANQGRTSLALSSPGSASTPRRSMRIKCR